MSLIADALRKRRLEETEGGETAPRVPVARPPIPAPPRRSPWPAVLGIFVVLLLAGAVWWVSFRGPGGPSPSEGGPSPSSPSTPVAAPAAAPAVAPADAAPAATDLASEVGRSEAIAPAARETALDARDQLQIERTVRRWQDARMDGEVAEVLAHYAGDFVPESGDRDSWAAEVRRALEDPEWIALALDDLRVEPAEPEGASVRFVETYRDPRRAHRSVRTLRMVRVAEHWKIVTESERLLEELPSGAPAILPPDSPEPATARPPADAVGDTGEGTGTRAAAGPTAREPGAGAGAPPPAAERELRLGDGSVLRLDFIVWSESNPFVQIDGVFLEPGDPIAGWRVTEIERDRVLLVGPEGREAVLRAR